MRTNSEEFDDGEEVIDEIRAVRHAISERCGHDPVKLVAYYMELERDDPGPYIPAPDLETPVEPRRSAA